MPKKKEKIAEERVSRGTIAPLVIAKIDAVAEPGRPIKETDRLLEDLGMTAGIRRAMALPFTKISKRFGGKLVRMSKSKKLKKVKDAIDLVHKKANS